MNKITSFIKSLFSKNKLKQDRCKYIVQGSFASLVKPGYIDKDGNITMLEILAVYALNEEQAITSSIIKAVIYEENQIEIRGKTAYIKE